MSNDYLIGSASKSFMLLYSFIPQYMLKYTIALLAVTLYLVSYLDLKMWSL